MSKFQWDILNVLNQTNSASISTVSVSAFMLLEMRLGYMKVSIWSSNREHNVQYDRWLGSTEIETRKVKTIQAFIGLLFRQELLQRDVLIYLRVIYALTPFFYRSVGIFNKINDQEYYIESDVFFGNIAHPCIPPSDLMILSMPPFH